QCQFTRRACERIPWDSQDLGVPKGTAELSPGRQSGTPVLGTSELGNEFPPTLFKPGRVWAHRRHREAGAERKMFAPNFHFLSRHFHRIKAQEPLVFSQAKSTISFNGRVIFQ